MSATNSTPTINLPVFIGTDKPAWLVDWNGAMNAIDSAIATLQTTESGTASSLAALAQSVTALSNTVSQHTTAIETVAQTTTTLAGNVNTINSLIGNGLPTTEDKTIIGAINEIYAEIGGGSSVTADVVSYDNTDSGLTADDVQEAIDELKNDIDAIVVPASSFEIVRGTLTTGQTSVALTASKTVAATALIDVFTDVYGLNPSAVSVAGAVVTLTFEAQASDVAVAIRIDG